MRDPHQQALIDAAHRLGVDVIDHRDVLGVDLVEFLYRGRAVMIRDGRMAQGLSLVADSICLDKSLTARFLGAMGLPTPRGVVVSTLDDPALDTFWREGATYVCKPLQCARGEGVVMDITSRDMLREVMSRALPLYKKLAVEETVPGYDLRLHLFGGHLVAACIREPASVVGDGVQTVAALAQARADEVQAANPQNRLVLGDEADRLLHTQGLTRASVPATGRRVQLCHAANISTGGRAVDVTDDIHPRWIEWAERVTQRLGLPSCGFDGITLDHTRDPETHGVILELNPRGQWLHHTFSERRTHDMPTLFLRAVLDL